MSNLQPKLCWWVVLRVREGKPPFCVSVPRSKKVDAERDKDVITKIKQYRHDYRVRKITLVSSNG